MLLKLGNLGFNIHQLDFVCNCVNLWHQIFELCFEFGTLANKLAHNRSYAWNTIVPAGIIQRVLSDKELDVIHNANLRGRVFKV